MAKRGRPIKHKENFKKCTVVLCPNHIKFIDKLLINMHFESTYYETSRSTIIRAFIEALSETDFLSRNEFLNCKSEEDIKIFIKNLIY